MRIDFTVLIVSCVSRQVSISMVTKLALSKYHCCLRFSSLVATLALREAGHVTVEISLHFMDSNSMIASVSATATARQQTAQ